MAAGKFVGAAIAIAAQVFLGPDTNDIVGVQEQPKLVREIKVGFVVGRGRKENALAGVARQIIAHGGPAAAVAVPQIVAFINDDDAVTA